MNSLFTIHPYDSQGTLVFDDPNVGLVREALVGGTDKILKTLATHAGANPDKFTLIFSSIPFPDHQASAVWNGKGDQDFGDWYSVVVPGVITEAMGWLCPALLKYFPDAPNVIYFQIKPIKEQV